MERKVSHSKQARLKNQEEPMHILTFLITDISHIIMCDMTIQNST